MYGKIKTIVSKCIAEHQIATKAGIDQNYFVDQLTVRLFDGLKEQPKPGKPKAQTPASSSLLSIINPGD
jgi:hypothetical protein